MSNQEIADLRKEVERLKKQVAEKDRKRQMQMSCCPIEASEYVSFFVTTKCRSLETRSITRQITWDARVVRLGKTRENIIAHGMFSCWSCASFSHDPQNTGHSGTPKCPKET